MLALVKTTAGPGLSLETVPDIEQLMDLLVEATAELKRRAEHVLRKAG